MAKKNRKRKTSAPTIQRIKVPAMSPATVEFHDGTDRIKANAAQVSELLNTLKAALYDLSLLGRLDPHYVARVEKRAQRIMSEVGVSHFIVAK